MRVIDADAWIKQLRAEVDNADVPDEYKDYNLHLINEIESRLMLEPAYDPYPLADCAKLESVQKEDSKISVTRTLLWRYIGKPMLFGGITGMLFTMLIVCLLHLIM